MEIDHIAVTALAAVEDSVEKIKAYAQSVSEASSQALVKMLSEHLSTEDGYLDAKDIHTGVKVLLDTGADVLWDHGAILRLAHKYDSSATMIHRGVDCSISPLVYDALVRVVKKNGPEHDYDSFVAGISAPTLTALLNMLVDVTLETHIEKDYCGADDIEFKDETEELIWEIVTRCVDASLSKASDRIDSDLITSIMGSPQYLRNRNSGITSLLAEIVKRNDGAAYIHFTSCVRGDCGLHRDCMDFYGDYNEWMAAKLVYTSDELLAMNILGASDMIRSGMLDLIRFPVNAYDMNQLTRCIIREFPVRDAQVWVHRLANDTAAESDRWGRWCENDMSLGPTLILMKSVWTGVAQTPDLSDVEAKARLVVSTLSRRTQGQHDMCYYNALELASRHFPFPVLEALAKGGVPIDAKDFIGESFVEKYASARPNGGAAEVDALRKWSGRHEEVYGKPPKRARRE